MPRGSEVTRAGLGEKQPLLKEAKGGASREMEESRRRGPRSLSTSALSLPLAYPGRCPWSGPCAHSREAQWCSTTEDTLIGGSGLTPAQSGERGYSSSRVRGNGGEQPATVPRGSP